MFASTILEHYWQTMFTKTVCVLRCGFNPNLSTPLCHRYSQTSNSCIDCHSQKDGELSLEMYDHERLVQKNTSSRSILLQLVLGGLVITSVSSRLIFGGLVQLFLCHRNRSRSGNGMTRPCHTQSKMSLCETVVLASDK